MISDLTTGMVPRSRLGLGGMHANELQHYLRDPIHHYRPRWPSPPHLHRPLVVPFAILVIPNLVLLHALELFWSPRQDRIVLVEPRRVQLDDRIPARDHTEGPSVVL